jgi:hypothetical protein
MATKGRYNPTMSALCGARGLKIETMTNPAIMHYNDSAVKSYNATNGQVRLLRICLLCSFLHQCSSCKCIDLRIVSSLAAQAEN